MNPIVHFEIPTEDLPRARKFYKKTFGWDLLSDQSTIQKKGIVRASFHARDKHTPHPVLIIKVNNLAEMLNQSQLNGAIIEMPTITTKDGALYAKIRDTEGNIIGLTEN